MGYFRFKSKYHPEEFERRQDEVRHALKRRCDVFFELMKKGYMDAVTSDTENHDVIVKLLDAGVYLLPLVFSTEQNCGLILCNFCKKFVKLFVTPFI